MTAETKEHKAMGRPRKYDGERRANITMQWPLEFIQSVDEAAEARGLSRTEFVIRTLEKELEQKQ